MDITQRAEIFLMDFSGLKKLGDSAARTSFRLLLRRFLFVLFRKYRICDNRGNEAEQGQIKSIAVLNGEQAAAPLPYMRAQRG